MIPATMLTKLKPLQIYLLSAVIGLLSGLLIRPLNNTAHSVVVVLAVLLFVYGIIRHFRTK